MRRNRRRIAFLAAAGFMNYWIAAILFVAGATIGAIIAFIVTGIAEGGDFELLFWLLRYIPRGIAWMIEAGWLSSATMAFAVLGFVGIGTIGAIVLMWGRVSLFEKRVPAQTGARSVADQQVFNVLEGVALAAGVPAPQLRFVDDPALNSYSVGRKPETAVIVVTTGLVQRLTRDELEAVLAYELSRVSSLDTALSTWTASVTGRTIELYETTDRILAKLALIIPAKLARRLQHRTLRRQASQRDILALNFTRHPEALLSALEKIDADKTPVSNARRATGPLWLKWPWWDPREGRTIPSLTGRIADLRALVSA
ncbi:MAG TPA: M48 family metalloprotease [Actinomycetota bacterium]|jgi:heat shock protein HtpX